MYKNKKNSLYCKYCKKTDHLIDTCTSILCKICNKSGHPHWNCKNSTSKHINNNQPSLQKNKISTDFNIFTDVKRKVVSADNKIANIPKSSTFSLDVFDKLVSQTDTKNLKNSLNYYIQIKDSKWSALL